MKQMIGWMLLIGLVNLSDNLHAVCGLTIVPSNVSVTWDLTWTIQAISLSLSKTNPAACTFGLGFSKGGAGSYTRYANNGGLHLNYQLYQDTGATKILKDAPDVTSVNDVVMVTLPAGSNPQTELFYFDIPYASATSPTLAAAGIFTDTFIINAYEGTDPSAFAAPPDATGTVNAQITVPKMVNLSLVDTGGAFQESATTKSIDFGNIFVGQVSRFDMRLRTNAGYSVTVTSTNNGRLKNTLVNSYVPYSFYVNNVLADPTGVSPVLTGSGTTSMSGLGYPVKIVIGSLGTLPIAGQYKDTVLITATATD